MAIATGAFARPVAAKPKREYPLLREQTYQFDFISIIEKQEASFDTRLKPAAEQVLVDRIEFKFALVLPGADEAQTALEALSGEAREKAFAAYKAKYLDRGHGRFFWMSANKTLSSGSNGKRASNAYLVVRGLLNEGLDLSPEQMRNVAELLNALEAESPRPQFYGYLTADKAKNRNNLDRIVGRVPEDELVPSWRQLARIADPREEGDDPSIVCEITGETIRGYEISAGPRAGEWVNNVDAAKMSKERYGRVLSPGEIRKVKVAQAAAPAEGKSAEKLPF